MQQIVEVSRGRKGEMRWKVMVNGITIHRALFAKAARKFAKNYRKLISRGNVDADFAAAFFAHGQMMDDADYDPYMDELDPVDMDYGPIPHRGSNA